VGRDNRWGKGRECESEGVEIKEVGDIKVRKWRGKRNER
jgi:hypothetical protein